jgi:hypothetical protein
MQINPLRAAVGWRWVRDGFALLRRQPIALLAITFLNLMLLSLSVLIPLFGPVAPLVLTPPLMVGLMHAMRAADANRTPSPALLFAGFRDAGGNAWRPLLVLGAFNAVATGSAGVALAAAISSGRPIDVSTSSEKSSAGVGSPVSLSFIPRVSAKSRGAPAPAGSPCDTRGAGTPTSSRSEASLST